MLGIVLGAVRFGVREQEQANNRELEDEERIVDRIRMTVKISGNPSIKVSLLL